MNARSASDDSARGQDTVFLRTALGNSAARAPDADLPRMVKTLLIAVDGRTSVRMFQKLLPNFGDVSALLDALEGGGYIEAVAAAPRSEAAAPAAARPTLRVVDPAAPAPRAPSDERRQSAAWFESTQRFQDTVAAPSRHSSQSASAVDFSADARAQMRSAPLSGHRSAVTEASRVREARTLMSEFLFEHLPAVAMEAVLALERLETTEQVISNLAEYQRLILGTGRKGADHLSAVRLVLST